MCPKITAPKGHIILDPDDFYILASREAVAVPPDHAAEMRAYDTLVGEFRVHYAGFFDPGFGHDAAGGKGSRAVLEVRSHDVPFVLHEAFTIDDDDQIVFESDTRAGRTFDVLEWLSILPTYFALLLPQASLFMDVRILRLLRVFRVLKLSGYASEYTALGLALRASRRKILIFMSFVMMVVLIMGTVMYVVEGPANGFSSIPTAMYWAVTTMTTVGFGDITPKTDLGRLISALMMLLGWSVLAVPTGIVTAEMSAQRLRPDPRSCSHCLSEGHAVSARFCWHCGTALPEPSAPQAVQPQD